MGPSVYQLGDSLVTVNAPPVAALPPGVSQLALAEALEPKGDYFRSPGTGRMLDAYRPYIPLPQSHPLDPSAINDDSFTFEGLLSVIGIGLGAAAYGASESALASGAGSSATAASAPAIVSAPASANLVGVGDAFGSAAEWEGGTAALGAGGASGASLLATAKSVSAVASGVSTVAGAARSAGLIGSHSSPAPAASTVQSAPAANDRSPARAVAASSASSSDFVAVASGLGLVLTIAMFLKG